MSEFMRSITTYFLIFPYKMSRNIEYCLVFLFFQNPWISQELLSTHISGGGRGRGEGSYGYMFGRP